MGGAPKVIYDFDPNSLPPELLRAIGLVVGASAQTESIVQELIGGLLGIDNIQARALSAHMSAPLKDSIARALAELSAPDLNDLDQLDDLLDAVNTAYERRNVIVHNAMMTHPDTGEVFSWRERARGSYQLTLEPVRVEEVEQDAALIYAAGMNLMRFMMGRGLLPMDRSTPLREPPRRTPKARADRRNRGETDPPA